LIANSASDNSGSSKNNNCLSYLFQTLKYPFPNIKFNYTYTKEIKKYINFESQKLTWIQLNFVKNFKIKHFIYQFTLNLHM